MRFFLYGGARKTPKFPILYLRLTFKLSCETEQSMPFLFDASRDSKRAQHVNAPKKQRARECLVFILPLLSKFHAKCVNQTLTLKRPHFVANDTNESLLFPDDDGST